MPDDVTVLPLKIPSAVTGGHYELPVYPFVQPAEVSGTLGRHPVVIIGGGLTGLTMACDFALRGVPAVLLDDDDTVGGRGAASRGICYSRKSLEHLQRLGVYERMRAKALACTPQRIWLDGREVLQRDDDACASACRQPAALYLQQFYVEWILVDRIYELAVVDLRWQSRVTAVHPHDDHVTLSVQTPQGAYGLQAAWVIDCSGAGSGIAATVGVDCSVEHSADRWCALDVRVRPAPQPKRCLWPRAPFNEQRAARLQPMADAVWRLDLQLADGVDRTLASERFVLSPQTVAQRVAALFGAERDHELLWIGGFDGHNRCLAHFRRGRVLFAGDAAHTVSPLAGVGGNMGIQDAENLVWKLALVLQGRAPEALIDSYEIERRAAALDAIECGRRCHRMLAPARPAERLWHQAAVALAPEAAFAGALLDRATPMPLVYQTPLTIDGGLAHAVPNVSLPLPGAAGEEADLLALVQRQPHALLALLSPAVDATLATQWAAVLGEQYPVQFVILAPDHGAALLPHIDAADALDAALGWAPERPALALLRPDLYCAGVLYEPTMASTERALRCALAAL